MHFNTPSLTSAPTGAEKPKNYPFERYQLYRYLPKPQSSVYEPTPHTSSDIFNSDPVRKDDEGPQTVEQVISQGYFAVPKMAPELAGIHDRRSTSWMGLDDIIGQVRKREEVYRKNMLELEWGKCYAFNELARGGWPASADQMTLYNKRLQELGAEQRAERVSAWRDISSIRQLFPENMQGYLSAVRKVDILDDDGGDAI
jgi:hypothetical protein